MNKLPEVIPFSNRRTKTRFQAQINNSKKEEGVNSITFYYQMTLPTKIHMQITDEGFDDVFERFEKTILGEAFGGVILEKYKLTEGVKCYLVHDGISYKIGQSSNPEKRLKQLKTANHKCELICFSELVSEKFLHEVYAHRNVGGEWFKLISSEVEVIINLMKITDKLRADAIMRMCARQIRRNKPNMQELEVRNVIKERRQEMSSYDKAKFSFGKYIGIKIKDMLSADQRKYLYWAYHNVGNLDKTIKSAIKIHLQL